MAEAMRIGIGYDIHRLVDGRPLLLGGIQIDYERGLLGHSDGDVVLHAVTDALLGAAGLPDIGDMFPDTDPAYDDAVVGLKPGDVLLMNNGNGQSVASVTDVKTNEEVWLQTGNQDPLDFNQQSGAAFGTFKSTLHPPDPGDTPPYAATTARRIFIVTYYIDDSDPDIPLLMRQVNGHPPMAVAEYVENLQVTYDIFDDDASVATAELVDAGGQPNQIRKINITLTVRSPGETMIGRDFQRITLTTSVGPRNLTYRDRYE